MAQVVPGPKGGEQPASLGVQVLHGVLGAGTARPDPPVTDRFPEERYQTTYGQPAWTPPVPGPDGRIEEAPPGWLSSWGDPPKENAAGSSADRPGSRAGEPAAADTASPRTGDTVVWEVIPPPTNLKDASSLEQLVGTLSGLQAPLAFEIAGVYGDRKLLLRGNVEDVRATAKRLYEVYGQIDIRPVEAEADPVHTLSAGARVSAGLGTSRPSFLAIKTWREFESQEPLLPLLSAFAGLAPGETALSQLVLRGLPPKDWATPHLRQVAALQRRGLGADMPVSPAGGARAVGAILLFLGAAGLVLWGMAQSIVLMALAILGAAGLVVASVFLLLGLRNQWSEAQVLDAVDKLRDDAFVVDLRLHAGAASAERAGQILDQLTAAYQLFNTTSGNRLDRITGGLTLDAGRLDGVPALPASILGRREIAGLWHLPVLETISLAQRAMFERFLPRPADVAADQSRLIGVSRRGEQAVQTYLSRHALDRNIAIFGRSQHGKSWLMENIAVGWMEQGEAVVVVDPHGDMAARLIGRVPAGRSEDVIYLDLSDRTQSAGINLLDVHSGQTPEEVVSSITDIGAAIWKEYWGWRMRVPVSHALRALAYANRHRPAESQYTLFAVPALLTARPEVREDFLEREVPREAAKTHLYFAGEYQQMTPAFRQEVISPVLSKIDAFEASPAIWRLLGQSRSTLDLYAAVRARKIVIINLSAGVIGDELADFIGSFVLNLVRRVIMAQAQMPLAERVRVGVVADEFHSLSGVDHGRLAGDLLKFGGHFLFATQATAHLLDAELGRKMLEGVLAGVSTVVALQCIGVDAKYLTENELDIERVSPESLVNLPVGHAYIKTVKAGGERIPVYSTELVANPDPDPDRAAAVRRGQQHYMVPADVADMAYRRSLELFFENALLAPSPTPAHAVGLVPREPFNPANLDVDRGLRMPPATPRNHSEPRDPGPQTPVSADAAGFEQVARRGLVIGQSRRRPAAPGARAIQERTP
jgi:hypothetical protein